jgi:hypothetical protein
MRFKHLLPIALLGFLEFSLSNSTLLAQGSAGSSSTLEPRYLVDVPTAGMLPNKSFAFDMDYFESGGMLANLSVGFFNRVDLGASFGGTNIVGADPPDWNKHIGVQAKVRILEENIALPAVALGFDSQGKEAFIDSLNRYKIKSMGLYAVGSKNYSMLGYLSVHGGINYSFEDGDLNKNMNFFLGAEKTIGPFASIVGEYNAALNDQDNESLGRGHGYLNFGARVSMGSGFTLSANLKDVIRNQQNVSIGNRTLQLEYVTRF